ncbi:hypothetical protein MMC13_005423 [Lambiella insularis]|nr:hypothetical protein [Lambiella insularis]
MSGCEQYLFFENGEERKLESVLDDESDMLRRLTYVEKWAQFQREIEQNEEKILKLVAQHIGVDVGNCRLSEEWLRGGFNLCIPVVVRGSQHPYQRLIFRVPLHFKLGEALIPGNVDEKIKTEAATYIFMRKQCPDVPILELLGFGLTNGDIYSPEGKKQSESDFHMGYLLLPFVADGRLLSEVMVEEDSPWRRENLYRSISQFMIHLAQVQHHHIGSPTLTEVGEIQITNRPLFLRLQWLENEDIETNIARDKTYNSTLSYWLDLLTGHDNRLRYQPNSMTDEEDGKKQMATLQILRERLHHLLDSSADERGYCLTITNPTKANFFVNEEWHITAIIDLDGACFWPIEMLHPPMWLTNKTIDEIVGEEEQRFELERTKFMNIFREEERVLCKSRLSDQMDLSWRRGSCWCGIILGNTTAAYNLIRDHFIPLFHDLRDFDETYESKAKAWTEDSDKFIQRKLDDLHEYRKQIAANVCSKNNGLE